MERTIRLIEETTPILESATAAYQSVRPDNNLRLAFRQAGKKIDLVKIVLERAKSHLQNGTQGGDLQASKDSIKACKDKAELAESAFQQVAQAPDNSGFRAYNRFLALEGRHNMVEVLVQGMMNDVCELVKAVGIEKLMQDNIEDLRDAIDNLKKLAPSAGTEEEGHHFNNFGEGDQFNATGLAQQYNNTGDGNQFPGATFQGSVAIGNRTPPDGI